MAKTETANDIDAQIGRNIARRRRALGLSQTNLAHAIGVSFQQVQKYEDGMNRTSGSRLYAIAKVLQCEPGDLFPSAEWGTTGDPSGAALDECARILIDVRPAIDAALRTAQGRGQALRYLSGGEQS